MCFIVKRSELQRYEKIGLYLEDVHFGGEIHFFFVRFHKHIFGHVHEEGLQRKAMLGSTTISYTKDFPPSATLWHKHLLALQQLNVCAMFEIIISVALYAAAIVFLVKSAFAYCNRSGRDIITEP